MRRMLKPITPGVVTHTTGVDGNHEIQSSIQKRSPSSDLNKPALPSKGHSHARAHSRTRPNFKNIRDSVESGFVTGQSLQPIHWWRADFRASLTREFQTEETVT
ncbi:hypothetical protein [Salipiger thiooxidans]|uniref:hypothetical protein n=1 Tax=Salipiger thiooxidans TaxID=282683 RepID=UPI001CFB1EA3|nr:hypothetical protein [Salipiger thiooxidans]